MEHPSVERFKDFFQQECWKFLAEEAIETLTQKQALLESEEEPLKLYRLQGEILQLRTFLDSEENYTGEP